MHTRHTAAAIVALPSRSSRSSHSFPAHPSPSHFRQSVSRLSSSPPSPCPLRIIFSRLHCREGRRSLLYRAPRSSPLQQPTARRSARGSAQCFINVHPF